MCVVGARPNFMKMAPILRALAAHQPPLPALLLHTGQHYDQDMSDRLFTDLGLPRPDIHLDVGSGSHAVQTAEVMRRFEPALDAHRPACVLVVGDVNSTLACTLVAVKKGVPVAHVEAGLRSRDRGMPEEINRVVVDHLASWLFAPTPTSVANLLAEGIVDGVVEVGDLMQDLAARVSAEVRDPAVLAGISQRLGAASGGVGGSWDGGLEQGRYLFATVHRAENREPGALRAWSSLLGEVARSDRPVILALHPGTRAALEAADLALPGTVRVIAPQGYRTTLALQLHAAAVMTDSGGVQREAAWLGVPCLVLRERTEWVEAVAASAGRMVLVGLDAQRAVAELDRLAGLLTAPADASARAAGSGFAPAGAAAAIVAALGERP